MTSRRLLPVALAGLCLVGCGSSHTTTVARTVTVTGASTDCVVANVVGDPLAEAREALDSLSCKVVVHGPWTGRVEAQSESAGESYPANHTIVLTMTKVPGAGTSTDCVVASVVGEPLLEARQALSNLHCGVVVHGPWTGRVAAQSESAGETYPANHTIVLTMTKVPGAAAGK
jgi:beta-lactam-binding protein with PASTA domain